jgi:hypothetical protein
MMSEEFPEQDEGIELGLESESPFDQPDMTTGMQSLDWDSEAEDDEQDPAEES